MNRYHLLAVLMVVAGVASLAVSVAKDEGAVHLILIFPVISINSIYSGLGALCLWGGILLFFFAFAADYEMVGFGDLEEYERRRRAVPASRGGPGYEPSPKVKTSGVLLIGPLPIVWGGSSRQVIVMMVLALIIMAVAFLILFYGL